MQRHIIEVIELPPFIRKARGLLTEQEVAHLKQELAKSPEKGVVIPGTGGIRKLRVAAKGKGKRGGARVIYFYYIHASHIYLLTCYSKNEQEDISADQKKSLQQVIALLTQEGKRK